MRHRSPETSARRSVAVVPLLAAALLGALLVWVAATPASAGAADVTVGCNGPNRTAAAVDIQSLRTAIVSQNQTAGPDRLILGLGCTYTFTDVYSGTYNSWYGPAALPAIASDITIVGNGSVLRRDPNVVAPFRLLFVGADGGNNRTANYATPGTGRLTLQDVTLANGWARGGGGGSGSGGGAGLGGAIFNQGQVTLDRVTIRDSIAQGGNGSGLTRSTGGGAGAGGMSIGVPGSSGGGFGFGFPDTIGSNGGAGGEGSYAGSGGGGGGFRRPENGQAGMVAGPGGAAGGTAGVGTGGAGGGVPNAPGRIGGNGSGGGGSASGGTQPFGSPGIGGVGGGFGYGGANGGNGAQGLQPANAGGGGGGGGVGGGGGAGGSGASIGAAGTTGGAGGAGGGGGFGGGGGVGGWGGTGGQPDIITNNGGDGGNGAQGGIGGFGGGGGGGGRAGDAQAGRPPGVRGRAGAPGEGNVGGFGGGNGTRGIADASGAGGGGAGMGGAIFNHQGTLTVRNTTLSGNAARGGAGGGKGLGIAGFAEDGQGLGGGIFNLNGVVDIDSSTIAYNQAGQAGGIYNLGYLSTDGTQCTASNCATYASKTTLTNSIVSNSANAATTAIDDLVAGRPATVVGGGTNHVTSTIELTGANIVPRSVTSGSGAISGSARTVDPLLVRTLEANPPTAEEPFPPPATHAIDRTSPAFDAGATALTVDARGAGRPAVTQDDIGAFEFRLITPTITLTAQPATAGLGDPVRVFAELDGGPRFIRGSVTFFLYGPDDEDCSGAPVATSVGPSNGSEATSGDVQLSVMGTYRWKATYSGDDNFYPVTSGCDATVEITKSTPVLSASALPRASVLGSPVRDNARVSGRLFLTGTITFRLHAPADTTCTGTPIFTNTQTVDNDGFARSTAFTPPAAGEYRWQATYSGDGRNNAVTGVCGGPDQGLTVAFQTTLNVVAVPTREPVGGTVRADATLVGANNPTGTVTFTLYRPSDTSCFSPIFTSTKTISAAGTVSSDPFVIDPFVQLNPLGVYSWKASYSGDANNPASIVQPCKAAGQTVEIVKTTPVVTGQATPTSTFPNQLVRDVATIKGMVLSSGQVTFELYPVSNTTCTGTRAGVVGINIGSGQYAEDGTITLTSPGIRVGAGSFKWVISYEGNSTNDAFRTSCSDPNQVVTVANIQPTITIGSVSPDPVLAGRPVQATAVLSGGPQSGIVSFNVRGPGTTCGAPENGYPYPGGVTIDDNGDGETQGEVNGDGTYRSGLFTPTEPGTYWWEATYSPTNGATNFARETCGPNSGFTVLEDVDGVVLSKTALDLTEGGAPDQYTMVLKTQPTADVTITPTATGFCTVSGPLTFTADNWDVDHFVTVTPLDDDRVQAGRSCTVRHTSASADEGYDARVIDSASGPVVEDDVVGVTVSDPTLSLREGGPTDSYTLVLRSQPGATVTITTRAYGPCSVVPGALTFTTTNWDQPQTVTVTPANDRIDQENNSCQVTHSSASSDAAYGDDLAIPGASGAVADDDTASIIVTGGDLTLVESGAPDTYTIVLGTEPVGAVLITPQASGLCSVSGDLLFTPDDWDKAQTVTVTPGNDDVAHAQSCTVTHVVQGNDATYRNIQPANASGPVADDDAVGEVLLSKTALTLAESGAADTYTVRLSQQPTASVTVTLTESGLCSASPGSITFTPTDWSSGRTVTVTPGDDDVVHAQSCTVAGSITSTDRAYAGIAVADVTGAVVDDDTASVTVAGTLVLAEGGSADTYTVVLGSEPTAPVTVTPTASGLCAVSSPLTFTAANWDTPQTVTVTPSDDDVVHDQTCSITHAVTSADVAYDGLAADGRSAAVADDDTAGVAITAGALTLDEADPSVEDTYTVVLTSKPISNVTVSVTPTDGQTTVDRVDLTFTAANWATPQTVTVRVDDDGFLEDNPHPGVIDHGTSSSDPAYDAFAPITVDGTTGDEVTVSISDNDTALTLGFSSPADDETPVTVTATVRGGDSPRTGTVQFTLDGVDVGGPVALVADVATLDLGLLPVGQRNVSATYGGDARHEGSAVQDGVYVVVRPRAFDDTLSIDEDAPATFIEVTANDKGVGTVADGAFTQGAHGDVTCDPFGCTYTPDADYHGTDSFTYRATDGSTVTDPATVTVTVASVNDAPEPGTVSVTVTEGRSVTFDLVDAATDVDGDTITVESYGQPAHGTVDCAPTGSCTYTPEAGFTGTDSFTYVLTDGVEAPLLRFVRRLSAPATATITVQAAPTTTTTSTSTTTSTTEPPTTTSTTEAPTTTSTSTTTPPTSTTTSTTEPPTTTSTSTTTTTEPPTTTSTSTTTTTEPPTTTSTSTTSTTSTTVPETTTSTSTTTSTTTPTTTSSTTSTTEPPTTTTTEPPTTTSTTSTTTPSTTTTSSTVPTGSTTTTSTTSTTSTTVPGSTTSTTTPTGSTTSTTEPGSTTSTTEPGSTTSTTEPGSTSTAPGSSTTVDDGGVSPAEATSTPPGSGTPSGAGAGSGPDAAGALPRTGSDPLPLTLTGVLLLVGGVAILRSRRRAASLLR